VGSSLAGGGKERVGGKGVIAESGRLWKGRYCLMKL